MADTGGRTTQMIIPSSCILHGFIMIVFGQKKIEVKLEFVVENYKHLSGKQLLSTEMNCCLRIFFNEHFLLNTLSSRTVVSHRWEQADGRTYTQFHSCVKQHTTYKSERNKQYIYYTLEKHSQSSYFSFPAWPVGKVTLGSGIQTQNYQPNYQCGSTDGVIYQSTLTKAHFTHFSHFLSWSCFFLLLQNIWRFKKEENPKVLVLFSCGAWAACSAWPES